LGKSRVFGLATLSSPPPFFDIIFQIPKHKTEYTFPFLLVYTKLHKKEIETSCYARPTFIPSLPPGLCPTRA
ncbi:hypothetical protein COO02_11535, partial [Bacillus pseudomycoides]